MHNQSPYLDSHKPLCFLMTIILGGDCLSLCYTKKKQEFLVLSIYIIPDIPITRGRSPQCYTCDIFNATFFLELFFIRIFFLQQLVRIIKESFNEIKTMFDTIVLKKFRIHCLCMSRGNFLESIFFNLII